MFRFTIRDVLWLTVVVAMGLTLWIGWSRDTAKLRQENVALEMKSQDEIKRLRFELFNVKAKINLHEKGIEF